MAAASQSVEDDMFVVSLQEKSLINFFSVFFDATPEFLDSLLKSILESTGSVEGFYCPERVRQAAQDHMTDCLQRSWPGVCGLVIFFGEEFAFQYIASAWKKETTRRLETGQSNLNWVVLEFKETIRELKLKPRIELRMDEVGVKSKDIMRKQLTFVANRFKVKIDFSIEKKRAPVTNSLLEISAEKIIAKVKSTEEIEALEIPATLKEGILRKKWGEKQWVRGAGRRNSSRLRKLRKFFCLG